MSTTDPRGRLRRRPWFMPLVRGVLWSLSGVFAFTIVFLLVAFPFNEVDWLLWCATVPLLFPVVVGITEANADDPARRAHHPWPYLLWIFGLLASCVGGGMLLGRAWLAVRGSAQGFEQRPAPWLVWLGALLLVFGAAVLLGAALVRARNATGAERARSIGLTGPRVPATVTEVTRSRIDNVKELWNVTLQFEDSQGTTRWHTLVHYNRMPIGSRHWIRYDPRKPRRRSTIFVEWDRA